MPNRYNGTTPPVVHDRGLHLKVLFAAFMDTRYNGFVLIGVSSNTAVFFYRAASKTDHRWDCASAPAEVKSSGVILRKEGQDR